MSDSGVLLVRYKNHAGSVSVRRVRPNGVPFFSSTEWHPEPQWILPVYDLDKQADRHFALRDCNFTDTEMKGEWDAALEHLLNAIKAKITVTAQSDLMGMEPIDGKTWHVVRIGDKVLAVCPEEALARTIATVMANALDSVDMAHDLGDPA